MLAEGIREAYDDLFRVSVKAYELQQPEVKNKLKTLTQGQKSDGVMDDMAKTFVALCALADWTSSPAPADSRAPIEEIPQDGSTPASHPSLPISQLCYNIQIILPATRDTAVYDALFKSLKEHLLK